MRILRFVLIAAFARAAAGAPDPGPSLPPDFFAAHRAAFLAKLPPGSVAVVRSAPVAESEVDSLYRQSSDFWYLTGLSEPGAVAVFRAGAPEGSRYVLFVQPRDFAQEQWTGWRAGPEGAKKEFGAEQAFVESDFWKELPGLWRENGFLCYGDGGDAAFRGKLLDAWRSRDAQSAELRPAADVGPVLHRIRLVKDATEQALLRRAAVLSAEAHVAAMKAVRPGRYEYALRAAMANVCESGGAARMPYPSIVGSGPNSVILHYERDEREMQAGEMIVNDSACEYRMYAADVTRSYPVSGKFTPEQRAIYDLVLAAQKAGFEKVRPGSAFHEVHDATVSVIVDGLLKLGVLKGTRDEAMRTRSYTAFYPHGSSHWLGLNVHDVGSYGFSNLDAPRLERYSLAEARLEPGMALTVEPGIYIRDHAEGVDPKWWNIGVRIEDDVLVTSSGMECLSCTAPREPAELLRVVGGR